jgi:RNA polymerase sigma-70 factor (ECF subfamily)
MRNKRARVDGLQRHQERQLLQRMFRGEPSAWNDFCRQHESLLVGCVLGVLRRYSARFTQADLADLVGEVWLTLLRDDCRKLRLYDAERGYRLSSWVGLIATNCTIDQLRMRQVDTAYLEDLSGGAEHLLVDPERPDRPLEQRQAATLARLALDRLSSEERRFVLSCFHEERPPAELASEMGVSINTIYSRKFKIRQKLARIVATLDEGLAGPQAELAA